MSWPTLQTLRAALPALAEEARIRATEFEAAKALADDFTDRLKAAGAYRVLLPPSRGGLGGTLNDWFDMGQRLAEADASTGWAVMHCACANAILQSLAQPSFAARVFADPDACCAWSNAPAAVTAERVAGGLRVNARWTFVTGCTAATYVGGMVPLTGADGRPAPVAVLMPRDAARIERTWDTMGLSGTGSHDVVVDDVFVPDEHTFGWPGGVAVGAFPWAIAAPGVWIIATTAAAVHLGLVRRMLDETRADLTGKKDRFAQQPLVAHPAILRVLERTEGTLSLIEGGMRDMLGQVWRQGEAGQAMDMAQRVYARNAAAAAVHVTTDLARAVFDIAGTNVVRRGGAMERLFRDANVLGQHIASAAFSFETTGRARGGLASMDARL